MVGFLAHSVCVKYTMSPNKNVPKLCHSVFCYNCDISLTIFTLFVHVETGMNTMQFTYLRVDIIAACFHFKFKRF